MTPDSVFRRNILFVSGKGGVGKTAVSQAIALRLNESGAKVLWTTFEDPFLPSHELRELRPGLFHLNCEPSQAFEEYASMKIGVASLARVFLRNKLMRYLSGAAPGIHELVLLGKVWYERKSYDHVVVDMPSTGYGLTMFQSTRNFARLFGGGPIHRDAEAMLQTFNNPRECGQLIVSLPEEMPLQESLELRDYLLDLFPENAPDFLVNRAFPKLARPPEPPSDPDPDRWPSPVARDGLDYAEKRAVLEEYNLKIWKEASLRWATLSYETEATGEALVGALARQLAARECL